MPTQLCAQGSQPQRRAVANALWVTVLHEDRRLAARTIKALEHVPMTTVKRQDVTVSMVDVVVAAFPAANQWQSTSAAGANGLREKDGQNQFTKDTTTHQQPHGAKDKTESESIKQSPAPHQAGKSPKPYRPRRSIDGLPQ